MNFINDEVNKFSGSSNTPFDHDVSQNGPINLDDTHEEGEDVT